MKSEERDDWVWGGERVCLIFWGPMTRLMVMILGWFLLGFYE